MAREVKLERLPSPEASRTIKDWFPTRESAEAALPAIRAHVKSTGQTHTCFCHTHTKPEATSIPVYLAEIDLPEKYLKAKRFCPCPCCWPEFGKFGRCMVAWFSGEKVIRLIGPDCFRSLNPEAHAEARRNFDIEQVRKHNTDFLLSNLPRLRGVIEVINRAIVVAKAVETFHGELHTKLAIVRMNLWEYARREGALSINVKQEVFRENREGDMRTDTEHSSHVAFVLNGYRMFNPELEPLSKPLEDIVRRLKPYDFGENSQADVEMMDDQARLKAADTLSRSVKRAKDKIEYVEDIRRFVDRVSINTLRSWGAHEGCPIPYNYSRDETRFSFGRSDYQNLTVQIPHGIEDHIGKIEFWVELEKRHR